MKNIKKFSIIFSAIFLIDAVFVFSSIQASTILFGEHIDGEALVKLVGSDKIYKIKYPASNLEELQKNIIASSLNNNIEYIEPNYIYHASLEPLDPFYTQEIHLSSIKANQAWNYTTGSMQYTIAIIDSGVDIDHPDLKNNIWQNLDEISGNGVDDDQNGYIDDTNGWDFATSGPDPRPKFGDNYSFLGMNHGTIIAGVAAAEGGNDIGIAGVAWHSRIMSLRVLDGAGIGSTLDVASAINYARENKADIINLSFVGDGNSETLERAIEKANRAGILVIAAAGNEVAEGIDMTNNPKYPVCHDGGPGDNWVIGVASIDKNEQLASFSNYGDCVDVTAPGVSIFSTLYKNNGYNQFNREYGGYWSGTSVSAPQVAGMAILVKSVKQNLSLIELKSLILDHAQNIDKYNLLYQNKLGKGKIDVLSSVIAARQFTTKADGYFDRIITAPSVGGGAHIKIYQASILESQFFAFDKEKQTGVNVATCDLDNNGGEEIIAGAGKNEEPWVKIFDINGDLKARFLAFDKNYRGGVRLAAGDVDHDLLSEIVVVSQIAEEPLVKIFDQLGNLKNQFYAFNKYTEMTVDIEVKDINNDNFSEIIIASGKGFSPYIKIFNYAGIMIGQFIAGQPDYLNGLSVAAGDVNGDGTTEIIVGNQSGSAPQVRVYTLDGKLLYGFMAYNEKFSGGVDVAASDVNADGIKEIVTGAGPGGGPHVRIFSYPDNVVGQFMAYGKEFNGGVRVSAGK